MLAQTLQYIRLVAARVLMAMSFEQCVNSAADQSYPAPHYAAVCSALCNRAPANLRLQ
jgi:hypothetical protein